MTYETNLNKVKAHHQYGKQFYKNFNAFYNDVILNEKPILFIAFYRYNN